MDNSIKEKKIQILEEVYAGSSFPLQASCPLLNYTLGSKEEALLPHFDVWACDVKLNLQLSKLLTV